MTVRTAILSAISEGFWSKSKAFSVVVGFRNRDGKEDETQLDLHTRRPHAKKKELEELWKSLHKELNAEIDAILYVEAYDCIV